MSNHLISIVDCLKAALTLVWFSSGSWIMLFSS